jgi:membrane-bound lytic murein transglycosylase B
VDLGSRHRGWAYLIDKLVSDGLPRDRVLRVFEDPRMPPFDGLGFSVSPREPHSMYRGFLSASSITAARRCRTEHAEILETAEQAHGVPASVVAAVLFVETGCGRNTGGSLVVHRLARLAMANEPVNLEENIDRLCTAGDGVAEERVRARARYLEDTFYPEVRAAFELADRMGIDPLGLRGSPSGAIGVPQFLPSNYFRYGIDGDADGRVDLFDSGDAAASCANYLASHGWRADLTESGRRAVMHRYNRSDAYVDAVLALARWIERPGLPAPVVARGRRKTVRTVARKAPAKTRRTPPKRVAQSKTR